MLYNIATKPQSVYKNCCFKFPIRITDMFYIYLRVNFMKLPVLHNAVYS